MESTLPPLSDAPLDDASQDGEEAAKKGWFSRLKTSLKKTSSKISQTLTQVIAHRKLDNALLEELEEVLLSADLGPTTARSLVDTLRRQRYMQDITVAEVQALLAEAIAERLAPFAQPLPWEAPCATAGATRPYVVLVVGVNGSGKTTTIGKLAARARQKGLSVRLVAGDTFRAAATEQLVLWGERTGVAVEAATTPTMDPAALVFQALEKARAAGEDLVIIDTAGRLHTNAGLMDELAKIVRVIRKFDPTAPHACPLVLDATIGQNAVVQAQHFRQHAPLSAFIMTKLDGTARGGVLVHVVTDAQLPVWVMGVGERADDLRPFDAKAFAYGLFGLDLQGDAPCS